MKLHYHPKTDSLYIELSSAPGVQTRVISDALNVDFGADGGVVCIDVDRASTQLDLATLETSALPFKVLRAA